MSNYINSYILDLADTKYYNSRQQIIRVKHPSTDGECFDFFIGQTTEIPNPTRHRIIVLTDKDLPGSLGINEKRLNFPPGYADGNGTLATLPVGICFLVSKNQIVKTTDPQSGSAGFSIDGAGMFDEQKLRVALGPPIEKDYTNNRQNQQDKNSIGLFMNDNAILLRTRGGAITMGDEGIHFGGKIFWESTKHGKEIMFDNPLHGLVPQTIPTAAVSIPQIPNFAMLAQIADGALKVMEITRKANKIIQIVS